MAAGTTQRRLLAIGLGMAAVIAMAATWFIVRERERSPALHAAPLPVEPVSPRAGPAGGGTIAAEPRATGPDASRVSPPGEEDLMARLRDEVDTRPALSLELAQEVERRFPGGRYSDERSFLKMRAMVHLGRIAAARDEAAEFFRRSPDSAYAKGVSRLTGMHPRPPTGGRGNSSSRKEGSP